MNQQNELLRFYTDELAYLRGMGREFAQQHPTVAARLEMQSGQSADPHVERLIESFAFLTARLQHELNSQFPEISTSLLSVLYPHLVQPVPPLAMARFKMDARRGKFTTGHTIPKHTRLFAYGSGGSACRFRTCYPTTVWPLTIQEAALEPPAKFDFLTSNSRVAGVLRIRISAIRNPNASPPPKGELAELEMDKLRFYLNPRSGPAFTLYELLFGALEEIYIVPDASAEPVALPVESLTPIGFAEDEDLLPHPPQSHPAYRLLQEYFHFPDKFLFFEVANLNRHRSQQHFDLLFVLNRVPRSRVWLDTDAIELGCTPVANLFPQTTEPIRLDQRQLYYRLAPDARREATTEIHSVLKVSGSTNPADEVRTYQPFYSYNHSAQGASTAAFWHSRRVMTGREDVPGTDIYLSFLDLNFRPTDPPGEVVFAHTLCTNRWLAVEVPPETAFQMEYVGPVTATCLTRPTPPVYPPLGGPAVWRLISNLSLNHLSIEGPNGLAVLKEILTAYCFAEQPCTVQQIQGIRELSTRETTLRVGRDAWRGFCTGREITLTFDENLDAGGSAFLFATVLRHFFALYASVNSFTRLVARRANREGNWKCWPPLVGRQPVI